MKRVMVDMSVTLLHHGHIRLLRSARNFGFVVVALTTDDEIRMQKGYEPELGYDARREMLESIRYVDEVVPAPWLIEERFLNQHRIDLWFLAVSSGKGWLDGWRMIAGDDT